MFTQPKMYNAIKKHPSALTLYTRKLLEDPEIASDEVDALQMRADSILKDAFDRRHEVKVGYVPHSHPHTRLPPPLSSHAARCGWVIVVCRNMRTGWSRTGVA